MVASAPFPLHQGAVRKLCRLKGGGGVKNCQFYLVKRRLRGREGVKNRKFCDDIVYGRPQRGKEYMNIAGFGKEEKGKLLIFQPIIFINLGFVS